jgi:hypothetical protein
VLAEDDIEKHKNYVKPNPCPASRSASKMVPSRSQNKDRADVLKKLTFLIYERVNIYRGSGQQPEMNRT